MTRLLTTIGKLSIPLAGIAVLVLSVLVQVSWASSDGPGEKTLHYYLCPIAFAFFGLAAATFWRHRSFTLVVAALVAIPLSLFSPIDISNIDFDGPPRVVPVVMGLPGPDLSARGRRGEVLLGGCIVSPWDPKWALVW